jgi:hypothetical protein
MSLLTEYDCDDPHDAPGGIDVEVEVEAVTDR